MTVPSGAIEIRARSTSSGNGDRRVELRAAREDEVPAPVDAKVAVTRERDRAVRGANLDEAGAVERDRERVVARRERAGAAVVPDLVETRTPPLEPSTSENAVRDC